MVGALTGCETIGGVAGEDGEPTGSLRVEAGLSTTRSGVEEFSALRLRLESIALDREDGDPVTLALERTLDLAELSFGEDVVFHEGTQVPAGRYTAYELVAPVERVRDAEGDPTELASESPYGGTFTTEPNDLPPGRRGLCGVGLSVQTISAGTILDVDVAFSVVPEE